MSLLTTYKPANLTTWFDDFFSDNAWFAPRAITGTYPPVEVKEEKDHYRLLAELPGLSKDEIKVEVNKGVLTISGEKKHEEKKEKESYYYNERSYGAFERSFNLGENVSNDSVEASFKDGILEVRLTKNPEKAPRQITVK
mgnify:FL=1